ncbi:MAG TPA: S-layer homology domain-containing protein [Bacillales bacterium]
MIKKILSVLVITIVALSVWIPQAEASTRDEVVSIAKKYIGVPYQWAGESPRGFDCSGFVEYVFRKVGMNLPETSSSQWSWSKATRVTNLKPGDLVFYNTSGGGVSHVGIYVGSGQFISATSDGVEITPVHGKYYWGSRYIGAKRVIHNQPKPERKPELPDYRYYDVDKDTWYYDEVTSLSKNDIFQGVGDNHFKPNGTVTRAQAATVFAREFNLKTSDRNTPFSDVPNNAWYSKYIEAVRKAGYMKGVGHGEFNPRAEITRRQIAILFNRAFELTSGSGGPDFKDVDANDPYQQFIENLAASGITMGYEDNTFRPRQDASRAEFAVFIYRALH